MLSGEYLHKSFGVLLFRIIVYSPFKIYIINRMDVPLTLKNYKNQLIVWIATVVNPF